MHPSRILPFLLACLLLAFSACGPNAPQPAVVMSVKESLADKGLNDKPFDLFLRVFKHEDVIEVWVKPQTASKYVHLQDFPVCQKSGDLGPKRQQGDLQVPEGVYFVDRFNPNSSYHLSALLLLGLLWSCGPEE
jgi:murein L,D-transpeptidase YafK